jgi:predicted nucleotidyltransferase
MDDSIRSELLDITEKILETLDVVKISLFGSYANGIPHKYNDFDIYVIIPSEVCAV